jgi:hypothetical protein
VKSEFAWQPVTPRGVACFAGASAGRLLAVQLVVALAAAAAVVWFVSQAWFPVVTEAIRRLPPQGSLRAGMLDWPANSPMILAEGHFLAFAVDLEHKDQTRSLAHLDVVLGRSSVKIYSLPGYLEAGYPLTGGTPLNQPELDPWWGAWAPPILAVVALGVTFGLLLTWWGLAALYAPLVWLGGFLANRDLSLAGSWRLAGAALMPGALFFTLAIVAYGLRMFDLLKLGLACVVHIVISWAYLALAPSCLPAPSGPATPAPAGNPFARPDESFAAARKSSTPRNPFAPPSRQTEAEPTPAKPGAGTGPGPSAARGETKP